MPKSPRTRAIWVRPRTPTFIWRDRIPVGMLTAIVGRQSGGKSLLSARMAIDLTTQGNRVILSSGENPRDYMTMPRLIASGLTGHAKRLVWLAGPAERYKFPRDLVL